MANTDTGAGGKKREAKAKREWIDAAGTECAEDEATGVRYTLLGNGGKLEYQFPDVANGARMLTCFGALTLLGNEVSAAINTRGESADEALAAARQRLDGIIRDGVWTSRERGPRIDLERLCEAWAEFMAVQQHKPQDDAAKQRFAAKAEADPDWARALHANGKIKDIYDRLSGRAQLTVEEMVV